ncbi:hypothetical protein scyTo_0012587 [Scyliorhinus torazame]|uniref:Calsyntenin-1 n=1 Tax=Scyliorhinus torazame TaxID=75743 RepID=A0A401NFM8_SCYTO|nr:hypothetical protein [Scyliorhinus torazame]
MHSVTEKFPIIVNKHKPWIETTYHGIVTENDISVLLDPPLIALDKDAPLRYAGEICGFRIHGQNVPFEAVVVDKTTGEGVIRSKEKMDCELQKEYTFTIQAYDCGEGPDGGNMKKSHKANVHIQVNDINEYSPVFKEKSYKATIIEGKKYDSVLRVEAIDADCSPQFSQICSYEIVTPDVPFTIDKDGAASGTIDLLPSPSSNTNWTIGLPTDNGHDSDQVFEFNGTQAVKIPEGVLTTNLKEPFTISVWMRHGPVSSIHGEKETILCNSDKRGMNRHHYSLYVHNCRLVFLFRQNPSENENFRPAEFHWKLDQVCDKEWHHYVLNVDIPTVALYVDGVSYDPFLVTEDYPLHHSKIETQLVVGACWQGGEFRMSQFFLGNLAGLMIRTGKIESKKVIDCLYTCKEGLDLLDSENLYKGVMVHFNPTQSMLSMEGDDIENFDKSMQHVSYLNSRQFPTPGIRRLKITTTVKCFNEETCITVPDVEGYVMVLQPDEPKISLSGIDHFARAASEFESNEGVPLFPELKIVSTITREVEPEGEDEDEPTVQESMVSEEIMHNLDTCEVSVVGDELNSEQESFEVDPSQLRQRSMEMSNSSTGMTITGVDTMSSYEEMLHLIRYRNWNSESLFERKFKLVCSELNGRYASNEFKVEVNVIHTANPVEHPNHVLAQPEFVRPVQHASVDLSGHNLASPHSSSVVPSAATVVIVVCVSFLVFMIILGVFRIRAAHQRTMRDQENGKENEMDWDDSALTITVNPMETYEDQHSSEEEEEEEEEESEEGDEEDDITSAESESSEEEEGEQEDQQNVNRQQQLEWDDSTLTY